MAVGSKRVETKEYFSEAEYGVKASPLVSTKRSRLPRGGGRDQVGRPYKIKGKWYYPKEQPGYSKRGKASWYGDAFHGRLTANGEIYDMTHLTAAHPTMPLPSYARVTNLKNGSSVIVRINDRGPYAHGRIIDLSKRAAEMLDYTHSGIAEVKVDYVGRAPLHGRDDDYLLASYRAGKVGPDPSDGLPSGVMIAMAGPTPRQGIGTLAAAAAFPGSLTSSGAADEADLVLPEEGPYIFDRPVAGLMRPVASSGDPALGYAGKSMAASSQRAVEALASGDLSGQAASAAWRGGTVGETIAIGTFHTLEAARDVASSLAPLGQTRVETSPAGQGTVYSLSLIATGSVDAALRVVWSVGQTDAFVVRD